MLYMCTHIYTCTLYDLIDSIYVCMKVCSFFLSFDYDGEGIQFLISVYLVSFLMSTPFSESSISFYPLLQLVGLKI